MGYADQRALAPLSQASNVFCVRDLSADAGCFHQLAAARECDGERGKSSTARAIRFKLRRFVSVCFGA
jgi:hypothetical protein